MRLWEAGRILEASLLAHRAPQGHPLSDPALRALVRNLGLPLEIHEIPEIKLEWLECDEVLALIALNLLHPVRRILLAQRLPDSFPPGCLGTFADALFALASVSDDEPLIWTESDAQKLAYAPETYGDLLRTHLDGFERDRLNKEANAIQALAREKFEPLRAMREWVRLNRNSTAGDVNQAIRVLTYEFGADYARAIGAKSKRESIARALVDQLDATSREIDPLRRRFVGGKKMGMIASLSRFLEALLSLAMIGDDNKTQIFVAERDAVRKTAELWLKTTLASDDVTPQAVLREVACSSGLTAPNGEIDFALWRYPRTPGSASEGRQIRAQSRDNRHGHYG